MIHARPQKNTSGELQTLHISLVGEDTIAYFQKILSAALNINYPEVPKEWRDLADMLDHKKVLSSS